MRLARTNTVSTEQLRQAVYAHDLAREWDAEALLNFTRRHRPPSTMEVKHPILCHGFVAAKLITNRFPTLSDEVAHAVTHHTLGSPSLSTLGKILFCADYLDPKRAHAIIPPIKYTAHLTIDMLLLAIVEHACHVGYARATITERMYRKIWKEVYLK